MWRGFRNKTISKERTYKKIFEALYLFSKEIFRLQLRQTHIIHDFFSAQSYGYTDSNFLLYFFICGYSFLTNKILYHSVLYLYNILRLNYPISWSLYSTLIIWSNKVVTRPILFFRPLTPEKMSMPERLCYLLGLNIATRWVVHRMYFH